MLPRSLAVLDRFQLARDVGFEEIECPTTPEPSKAEEILAASKKAGLRIHSVMNQEHWRSPLSSSDAAVVENYAANSLVSGISSYHPGCHGANRVRPTTRSRWKEPLSRAAVVHGWQLRSRPVLSTSDNPCSYTSDYIRSATKPRRPAIAINFPTTVGPNSYT